MGVKGLVQWIQSTHPAVIQRLPRRWASPQIRGKRVAIDATLLTNRFHFGNKILSMRGTASLLGCMIRDMRNQGVEPVAVWDERGVRPWKAAEAERRSHRRMTMLARLMHEDRRGQRLARLQEELEIHRGLSDVERGIVAEALKSGIQPIPYQPSSLSWPVSNPTLLGILYVARLAAHIQNLDELWVEHRLQSQGELSSLEKSDPIDPLEDLQDEPHILEDEEGRATEGVEEDELAELSQAPASHDRSKFLPAAVYTESQRQRALSVLEAKLWQLLALQRKDTLPEGLDGEIDARSIDYAEQQSEDAEAPDFEDTITIDELPDDASTMVQDTPNLPGAMALLDEIITSSQPVRNTYLSALDAPVEEHHESCRNLLTAMGVPILTAPIPFEAEGLASALALAGVVDYVGTEDSDVIVYGCSMLRNMTSPGQPLVVVDSATLRSAVQLQPDEFRDFCILLGTDASPRIPGVGPFRAYTLIEEHHSIEGILEAREDLASIAGEEFMELVENARRLFAELPPIEGWDKDGGNLKDRGMEWLKEQGIEVKQTGRQGTEEWWGVERDAMEKRQGAWLDEAWLEERELEHTDTWIPEQELHRSGEVVVENIVEEGPKDAWIDEAWLEDREEDLDFEWTAIPPPQQPLPQQPYVPKWRRLTDEEKKILKGETFVAARKARSLARAQRLERQPPKEEEIKKVPSAKNVRVKKKRKHDDWVEKAWLEERLDVAYTPSPRRHPPQGRGDPAAEVEKKNLQVLKLKTARKVRDELLAAKKAAYLARTV